MENKKAKIEEGPVTASKQIWSLAEEGIGTDCFVTVENQENSKKFKLHKMILMKSSPVFKEMFETNNTRLPVVIKVENIEPRIMEMAFKNIYGYDCFFDLTREDIRDLLYVADKYEINTLIESCTKYTFDNLISPDNISFIRKLKPLFRNSFYQKNVLKQLREVMSEKTEEWLKTEDLLDFNANEIENILNWDKFNLKSELELIKFVDRWAITTVNKQGKISIGIEYEIRKIIEPKVLPLLRFLTLSKEEFTDVCINYNWLTREEKQHILKSITTGKTSEEFPLNLSPNTVKRCQQTERKIVKFYGHFQQIDPYDITEGFYDPSVDIAIPKDLLSVKLSNQNIIHCKNDDDINRPKEFSFNFEIDSNQYSLVGLHIFTEPNFELNKNVYHEERNILIKCNGSIMPIKIKLLAHYNSIVTTTLKTTVNLKSSLVYSIHSEYVSDKKYYKYASPVQEIKLGSNYMLITGDIGFFRALILKKN